MPRISRTLSFRNITLGFLAALLFLVLATTKLDKQGLYYDELHQATAAFAYIGQPPQLFASLMFDNLPVLNMPYSGAIKTAVYGLYLKITGASFSVISWRLVGILFVCLGLLLFALIVKDKLPTWALLLFYFLTLSDLTLVLTTRFDWGPVALALLFRLVFLAVWIKGELSDKVPIGNSVWLGLLVGISIFEKLSSVVLVIPLLFMVFLSPRRRKLAHLLAVSAGGLIGCIPLILVNRLSLQQKSYLISLQAVDSHHVYSLSNFLSILRQFLSLGAGEQAQGFILGRTNLGINSIIELCLLLLTFAGLFFVLAWKRPKSRLAFMAWMMLLCYAGVQVALFFIPQATWIHHWIIGTPFQYAAIAFAIGALVEEKALSDRRWLKYPVYAILVIFCLFRTYGLVSLEQAFLRGDASINWDPAYTTLAEFAAGRTSDSIFVAEDWGIGTQLVCFLNGKPGTVIFPNYYATDGDTQQTADYIQQHLPMQVYLLFPNPPYMVDAQKRAMMIAALEKALAPGWQVTAVDPQIANMKAISIIKLVHVSTTQP